MPGSGGTDTSNGSLDHHKSANPRLKCCLVGPYFPVNDQFKVIYLQIDALNMGLYSGINHIMKYKSWFKADQWLTM